MIKIQVSLFSFRRIVTQSKLNQTNIEYIPNYPELYQTILFSNFARFRWKMASEKVCRWPRRVGQAWKSSRYKQQELLYLSWYSNRLYDLLNTTSNISFVPSSPLRDNASFLTWSMRCFDSLLLYLLWKIGHHSNIYYQKKKEKKIDLLASQRFLYRSPSREQNISIYCNNIYDFIYFINKMPAF